MRSRAMAGVVLVLTALLAGSGPAAAQGCRRAVIFTTPGVTWAQVRLHRPVNLLELTERGAVGSVAVRTNSSRTTYASGFATIGAGTRIDVPIGGAQPVVSEEGRRAVVVAGIETIDELAAQQGYSVARAGAFGDAVSDAPRHPNGVAAVGNADFHPAPSVPLGLQRYPLLAAMDTSGEVEVAATGTDLLEIDDDAPFGIKTDPEAIADVVGDVLQDPCAVAVIDHGDLLRADRASAAAIDPGDLAEARGDALEASDQLLGRIAALLDLDDDLLLVVSPTSPQWEDSVHFGIAVAAGPGFEEGHMLSSPSTRRPGIVTLPDVAPTVLDHLGIARPSSMLGRSWFSQRAVPPPNGSPRPRS